MENMFTTVFKVLHGDQWNLKHMWYSNDNIAYMLKLKNMFSTMNNGDFFNEGIAQNACLKV